MLFTEPAFLFLFLPVLLATYFLIGRRFRNLILAVFSLYFYSIGEVYYVWLLLASCGFNYIMALKIEKANDRQTSRKWLIGALVLNLLILAVFKYTNFIIENLNYLLLWVGWQIPQPKIRMPLGVTFFTFHTISYVVDVYRGVIPAEKNLGKIILYISLFPHLIAGPIVRYQEIVEQIHQRFHNLEGFSYGIKRFILGLGKKMMIANTLAQPADNIFAQPPDQLSSPVAWLGIVCYALQLYFDFSGYSDMAIGLAMMFGFRFPENFNYPYISSSVTEFWRRWHITLSTWFRDYLYIPLGGNRVALSRVYFNLLVVFFLCGLWHGAHWTFIIWGLFHGLFLILERMKLLDWLTRSPGPWKHLYLITVVLIGWVFFRSETLTDAWQYIAVMFGFHANTVTLHPLEMFVNLPVVLALIAGFLGSMPILPTLERSLPKLIDKLTPIPHLLHPLVDISGSIALAGIFLVSLTLSAAGTYNPFIYFRF